MDGNGTRAKFQPTSGQAGKSASVRGRRGQSALERRVISCDLLWRRGNFSGSAEIRKVLLNRYSIRGENMIQLVSVPHKGQRMQELTTRTGRVLTFDVGGSHVAAALRTFDTLSSGSVVSGPLSAAVTLGRFLDLLYHLGLQTCGRLDDLDGAVLAMPGPFDYAAGISRMRHKLEFLCGIDLRQSLAERFGWTPAQIRFVNDAEAFLLGEPGSGAAEGAQRAVGITLGTGIGSAFACKSRLVTGGQGAPPWGEIWNLPFAGGTVEGSISTNALQRDYEVRTGRWKEVKAIALAAKSEAEARTAFEAFGRNLGNVARDILGQFSPEIVVLGGGISRSAHLFLPAAEKALKGAGFRLATSHLWDRAALVGGAVHWRESEGASMQQGFGAQLGVAR